MRTSIEKESSYKNYQQDAEGFWRKDTGEAVGHEEECLETYESLSKLSSVFDEIDNGLAKKSVHDNCVPK